MRDTCSLRICLWGTSFPANRALFCLAALSAMAPGSFLAAIAAAVLALVPVAHSTWSVIVRLRLADDRAPSRSPLTSARTPFRSPTPSQIVDQVTREVGIAAVTCLTGFDLKEALPVISVGRGGGVSQASVDSDASRRAIMKEGFEAGRSLDEIFAELATRPGHESRQYGMVNVNDEALTFTGAATSVRSHAGGRVGAAACSDTLHSPASCSCRPRTMRKA